MGDQGTKGIESSGLGNHTRHLSEQHTNRPASEEDQIQQACPEPESTTREVEEVDLSPRHIRTGSLSSRKATSGYAVPVTVPVRVQDNSTPPPPSRRRTAGGFNTLRPKGPLEPPVTKATLSELDVNKIIHNPKLRHDINFDPELHFRPNLDGEKGKRKQDKANQFWTSLREQLVLFVTDRDEFQRRHSSGEDWSLPLLLKSVKEIIQTLVPARDRMYLDEGLNVDLIMQQFNRGIADLEKLASWLSGVLKSHCAPMRDDWVDEMYHQLTNGNQTNDMEQLVAGMRSLLCVLEAMKLDVANHQIRCLRPILIEDTVHFEQRFFMKKIQNGKLEKQSAQEWYDSAKQDFSNDTTSAQAFGEMAPFFEALVELILPSCQDTLPNTFLFDEERVVKLRADTLDAINLEICMQLYEQLESQFKNHGSPLSLGSLSTPFLATPASDASGFLSANMDEESFDFNFNRPISRPVSMISSSSSDSATSSPRSSMAVPIPTSTKHDDARTRSRNLYNSLVALLHTSPSSTRPAQRWKAMKDSFALQILRFTNAPTDVLVKFEDELDKHLSEPNSPIFKEVERQFQARLLRELQRRVKELKVLNGVSLFSVATGGRLHGPGRTWDGPRESPREHDFADSSARDGREDGGIEDMATRLAHLGLLHWRVWSPIVYNVDADTEMSIDSHMEG